MQCCNDRISALSKSVCLGLPLGISAYVAAISIAALVFPQSIVGTWVAAHLTQQQVIIALCTSIALATLFSLGCYCSLKSPAPKPIENEKPFITPLRDLLGMPSNAIDDHAKSILPRFQQRLSPAQKQQYEQYTSSSKENHPWIGKPLFSGADFIVRHGAMHASFNALMIPLFLDLHREAGSPEAFQVTNDEVLYLMIVALFHDSGRVSISQDLSGDTPKMEKEGAQACFKYLTSVLHLPVKKARFFANLIIEKEKCQEVTIFHDLLYDVDVLAVLRADDWFFSKTFLRFFQKYGGDPVLLASLDGVILEAKKFLVSLGDSPFSMEIFGEKIEGSFDLSLKRQYELDPDCYGVMELAMSNFPVLKARYNRGLLSSMFVVKTSSLKAAYEESFDYNNHFHYLIPEDLAFLLNAYCLKHQKNTFRDTTNVKVIGYDDSSFFRLNEYLSAILPHLNEGESIKLLFSLKTKEPKDNPHYIPLFLRKEGQVLKVFIHDAVNGIAFDADSHHGLIEALSEVARKYSLALDCIVSSAKIQENKINSSIHGYQALLFFMKEGCLLFDSFKEADFVPRKLMIKDKEKMYIRHLKAEKLPPRLLKFSTRQLLEVPHQNPSLFDIHSNATISSKKGITLGNYITQHSSQHGFNVAASTNMHKYRHRILTILKELCILDTRFNPPGLNVYQARMAFLSYPTLH